MNSIHTTGYPRSGNNWTSEFLSDLLSSPVVRGDTPVWFGEKHGKYTLKFHHARVHELDDWLNHYTREAGELSEKYHGKLMRLQGYTTTTDWWQQLPVKV